MDHNSNPYLTPTSPLAKRVAVSDLLPLVLSLVPILIASCLYGAFVFGAPSPNPVVRDFSILMCFVFALSSLVVGTRLAIKRSTLRTWSAIALSLIELVGMFVFMSALMAP